MHTSSHAHQRGAVIVIVLLATLLLAGLVMFVVNQGQQVNRRVVTQHTADATAAAGAGWVARSLNTVAMNNVAQARLIALVNVLDAMPMATDFTHTDQSAVLEAVRAQLGRSMDNFPDRQALEKIRGELEAELAILEPMRDFFTNTYDVRRMTYCYGPSGRGQLWQAMEALDDFSQATMENLGELAQLSAVNGGEVSAGGAGAQPVAFIAPVVPVVPWRRGSFDDFERPVRMGLLPRGVDNALTNRGPYDTIFGWRFLIGRQSSGYWVPGDRDVAGEGRGQVPIGRGTGGDGGRYVVTGRTGATGYRVFGPYRWMLNHVSSFRWSHLPHSRFDTYAQRLSDIKLGYLWPGGAIRRVVEPRWVTSYNQAVAIAEAGAPTIRETAFVAIEIKSRYASDHPSFGAPGSWVYFERTGRTTSPRVAWIGNWMDPERWGVPRIASDIWRDEWSYTVNYDHSIGVRRVNDAQGNPVPQTVYRIDDYVFVGVNVGQEVEVANPHNFTNRRELPAPIDLDHAQLPPTTQARRQSLTYLSVASRGDAALMWPARFGGGKPWPRVVCVAQATVFNNHSWDLWTQMWAAELEPVSRWDDWLDTLDAGAGDAQAIPDIPAEEYQRLLTYLTNLRSLASATLTH